MTKKIAKVTLVPRTEDSIPWGAADRQLVPIRLERYGYVEEEYFYSNLANIYTLKEGRAQIKEENAPYTNRFIVRKPKNPQDFSGNVVVEILNATNGWDVAPMWCLLWQGILSDKDVYIGVTGRSICTESLKKYNESRYGELSWKNPNPSPVNENLFIPAHCAPEREDGFIWDMITQLGDLLKDEVGTELIGKKVEHVYLTGCSQSSMQMSTYHNVFHETDRPSPVAPVFDGYLGYSGCRMVTLNQAEEQPTVEDEVQQTRNCPVPIIRCMTQWDFKDFAGHLKLRREDSDEIGDRFRLYELAGQAHNSFSGAFYRPGYEEIAAIERTTGLPATDYVAHPLEAFMRQNLRNLKIWSTGGEAPGHAKSFIEVDDNGMEALDENMNCKGGFRFPQMDVPIATYCSGTSKNDQDSCFIPFSEEKLKELYPTRADYIDKIFATIEEMIDERFISPEDGDALKLEILKQPVPSLDYSSKM